MFIYDYSTDLTVENIFWLIQSVKINWFDSEKYFCTDESVKMQITGSISENLTDSDWKSGYPFLCVYLVGQINIFLLKKYLRKFRKPCGN